jgi:hypothetical protein
MNFSNYLKQSAQISESANMSNVGVRTIGYCTNVPYNVGDLQTISEMIRLSELEASACNLVLIGNINDPYINKLTCKLNESLPNVKIFAFRSITEHLLSLNESNHYPNIIIGGDVAIAESTKIVSKLFGDKETKFISTSTDYFNKKCIEAVQNNDLPQFVSYLTSYDESNEGAVFEDFRQRVLNG